MSTVLAVNDVWKAYPDVTGTPRTLRAAVARRTPLLRRGGERRWALRGIELELGAGEAVGLVGHNGSGKSTLLRLVAGLGRPTRGHIAAHPDTSAVLSLGASFDALLTGRENAMTAAIVAGMSRREARRALDAMLDFSELGDFVDAPVRTYSEGMKLRLAFGLLATVDPRLLVLDEVLAVGDTAFRARCLERIRAMRASGTALMLASHAVSELEAVAERAVWLHRGAIRMVGPLDEVVAGYERAMHDAMLAATPVGAATRDGRGEGALVMGESRFGSQAASITEVTVGGVPLPAGATVQLTAGAPLRLGLTLAASDRPLDSVIVSVCIRDEHGIAAIDLHDAESGLAPAPGDPPLRCTLELERVDLRDGEYTLDVGLYGADWDEVHDFHYGAYRLRVRGTDSRAMLVPPHRWQRGA